MYYHGKLLGPILVRRSLFERVYRSEVMPSRKIGPMVHQWTICIVIGSFSEKDFTSGRKSLFKLVHILTRIGQNSFRS